MLEGSALYYTDPANDTDILKLIMAHIQKCHKNFRRVYSLFGNNPQLISHLMQEKTANDEFVVNNGNINDYRSTNRLRIVQRNFDDFIDEITADDLVIIVPPPPYTPSGEHQKRLQHFIEALDKINASFILFYGKLDKTNDFPISWRWGHTIKMFREPSPANQVTLHHLYLSRNFADLVMQKAHYGQTLQPLFHVMFEVHAANHPNVLAVVSEEHSLTYGQLNKRANQFVQLLIMHGLSTLRAEAEKNIKDCVVAIAFGRNNPQTLIAELATEKAGVTKLLVNTDTRRVPVKASLESIINSDAVMLISNPTFRDELREEAKKCGYLSHFEMIKVLLINEVDFDCGIAITNSLQKEAENHAVNPNYPVSPQATIYLGETSGTTGTAKFARIPFGGLPFATSAHIQALLLQPGGRTLQLVAKKFDARFLEISMTLGSLGTVVLSDYETYENYQKLACVLHTQKITCLTVVPALLEQLLTVETFPFVTNWLVVGDGVDSKLLDKLWDKLSEFQRPFSILFGYGTTQTTIQGSYLLYVKGKSLTAGWPAFGLQLTYPSYVDMKQHRDLKKKVFITQRELQDRGIKQLTAGEKPQDVLVLAAGPCRMKGYLNSEEKIDPLLDNEVFFNTGDKAILMPDASILICERSLRRPKIYGQIVSLKAVEECIIKQENIVADVRVVAHTIESRDGKKIKKLAAYIVPINKHFVVDNASKPSTESLQTMRLIRENLLKSIPTYAVPALVNMLLVTILPRSENKKAPNDPEIRRQWPLPCLHISRANIYQEELTGLEPGERSFLEKAQDIAAMIIGLNPAEIGFNDRLDELGFDSLLRMRFVSQLKSIDLQLIGMNNSKFQKALAALSIGDFQKNATLLSLYKFLSKQAQIGRNESTERLSLLERNPKSSSDHIMLTHYRIHKSRSLGTIEIPCYFIPSLSGLTHLDYGASELLNLPFEITLLTPPNLQVLANINRETLFTEHYSAQIEPKHGVVFLVAWSSGGIEGKQLADSFRKQGVNAYLFILDTTHPQLLQQYTNTAFAEELVRIGRIVRKNILALLELPENTPFFTPPATQIATYTTKAEQVEFLFKQLNATFASLLLSKQFNAEKIAACKVTLQAGRLQLLNALTSATITSQTLTAGDTLILAEKSVSSSNQTLGWKSQKNVNIVIAKDVDHFGLLQNEEVTNKIKEIAIQQLKENAEPICRGIAYSMQNEHKAALRCFNEVASNNPQNYEYLYYRALSNFKLERYADALADLNLYLTQDANNFSALFLLARIYYETEAYEKALNTFYNMAQLIKEPIFYYAIASYMFNSLKLLGDNFSDMTLKNKLESLIQSTPILHAPMLAMPMADILSTARIATKKMQETLDKAIRLDPSNPTIFYIKGGVELKLGHYQAASEAFLRASELGGGNKGLNLYYQGLVKFEEEQYYQACKLLTEVIQYNKVKVAQAYLYRGLAFNHLNDSKIALSDLNKALESCEDTTSNSLHPLEHVKALNARGTIHKEQKNFHDALSDFTKAASLDTQNVFAHYNAGNMAKSMAINLIPTAKINETARLNTIERYFQTACDHIQKAADIFPEGSASKQNMLRELEDIKEKLDSFKKSFHHHFNKKQETLSALLHPANTINKEMTNSVYKKQEKPMPESLPPTQFFTLPSSQVKQTQILNKDDVSTSVVKKSGDAPAPFKPS